MNAHGSIMTPGLVRLRGWRLGNLRAWFRREGVTPGLATAGVRGEPVDETSFHALGRISIVGIPQWPFQPNRQAVLEHLVGSSSRLAATMATPSWKSLMTIPMTATRDTHGC